MKINYDILRLILLDLEGEEEVDLSNVSEEELAFHRYVLWDERLAYGFEDSSHSSLRSAQLDNLTLEGQGFLDAIRNDTIWNKFKALLKEGAGISLAVARAVLQKLIMEHLGLA